MTIDMHRNPGGGGKFLDPDHLSRNGGMDGGGDELGGIGDLLSFGHDIADLDDRLGGDAQILLQRKNHALRQGGFPDR